MKAKILAAVDLSLSLLQLLSIVTVGCLWSKFPSCASTAACILSEEHQAYLSTAFGVKMDGAPE